MTSNKMPLVSIITPSYNSEDFISQTINSIINQTYTNWELLITDDCSTDETVAVITKYIFLDKRIKLYKLKNNLGSATARNNSISFSKGLFIAFCDSDDIWLPCKLDTQLQFMILNKISFCFTAYEVINDKGLPINILVDSKQNGFFTYNNMLKKKATLGCCTVMLKKTSFTGLLEMPNIRIGQDYAFWLKLLKNSNHFAYILPKVLSRYRISPNSISRNKFKKAKKQFFIYRKIENINFIKSIYYFLFYALRAIFRTS